MDGYIARKYNMVTELGKCLDPVADKLTQFILLICLFTKYPMAKVTLSILAIEEIIVPVVGYKAVCAQGKNDGAKWYGKLSTVIFYIVTVVLVLFTNINITLANILLGISGVAMLVAFVGYMNKYVNILFKEKGE